MKFALLLLVLLSSIVSKAADSAGNRNACKMFFGYGLPNTRINRVKSLQAMAIQQINALDQGFRSIYQILPQLKLKKDFNAMAEQITELNNAALDLLVLIREEKDIFSSASERKIRDEMISNTKILFARQDLPEDAIERLVLRRLQLWEQEQAEAKKRTALGFLPASGSSSQSASRKTIGFARAPLMSEGYGRNPVEMAPNFSGWSIVGRPRVAVAVSDLEAERAAKTPSIGFMNNQEVQDEGYVMRPAFDFNNGVFTLEKVSETPMGFVKTP